ncbi:MAG: PspC domain-containing protein [Propionibacteriaceae bacterium]
MEKTWELERHPEAGHIGGVCSALSMRWGIDPLLIRAVVVIAALADGFGIVLYFGACALLPASNKNKSWAEEKFPIFARIPRSTQLAGLLLAAFLLSSMASKNLLHTYWQLIIVGLLIWYGNRHAQLAKEQSITAEASTTAANFAYHAQLWQERVAQAKAVTTTPAILDDTFWSHPDPAGIYVEENPSAIITASITDHYPRRNPLLVSLRVILWLATLVFLFIFSLNAQDSADWPTNLWLLAIPLLFIFGAHLCSKGIRRG